MKVGMKAPDFDFITPWKEENNFYNCIEGKKSFLIFLRYYGCRTCQLEMLNLIDDCQKFTDKGAQLFVVLQSDPKVIRDQVKEEEIPFTIICDTYQSFYKKYDVKAAEKAPDQLSAGLLKKIEQAEKIGLVHGAYEGNELQLPATFLINSNKEIEFVYYGKDSADVPDNDELLALL